MDDRALELRVGMVVLAAVAVLVGFVLVIGDFRFSKDFKIFVDFKFSGAIAAGAPVKISGVQIGRVENIEFIGAKPGAAGERLQTRLTVAIDERVKDALPLGTEFFVSTAGILGEQYLEAVPGDRVASPISPGAVLRGVDPPRTDLLIARMNNVLDAFSRLLSDNRGLLEDLARAATGLTKNIDDVLSEKKGAISKTIDNLTAVSEDARQIAAKVNHGMGTAEELRKTVHDLQKVVATLEGGVPELSGRAQKTLEEATRVLALVDSDKIKRTLTNVETVTSNAAELSDDTKMLTKKLRRGEGTIGALLSDEDIYDDLKEMLRDLKQHPWKVIWRD